MKILHNISGKRANTNRESPGLGSSSSNAPKLINMDFCRINCGEDPKNLVVQSGAIFLVSRCCNIKIKY